MYYFGYYAHQEPQQGPPTRPRHELHPIDKVAFMRRWYDYHYRRPFQGHILKSPLLTLPNPTLGLPPTEEELKEFDLPLDLAGNKAVYAPTEERIQPTIAETFDGDVPRPADIPQDTWDVWKPVVEDHLITAQYDDYAWSHSMVDFQQDAHTYYIVEAIRLAIAKYWAMKVRYYPLYFDNLVFISQRYGHNIHAMLNWLLWDLQITHIPRFRLRDVGLPPEWMEIFTDNWPKVLEEDYQWWNTEPDKKTVVKGLALLEGDD